MIFVDTGAWIALTDKSDQYHNDAIEIYSKLKLQRERFLTTDYVIDETVTRLRYDAGHKIAINFLELINLSEEVRILQIVHVDKKLFKDAISIFTKYDPEVLSFMDCTSFALCRNFDIHRAFTFDKHFTMMGILLCLIGGRKYVACSRDRLSGLG